MRETGARRTPYTIATTGQRASRHTGAPSTCQHCRDESAQSITVLFGDTRIIEWDIDLPDETPDDPDDNLPLDLSGKPVRWVLHRTPRLEPVIAYNSAAMTRSVLITRNKGL